MFEALQQFKTKHGHTDVPGNYEVNPKLGDWVRRQRDGYCCYQSGYHNGKCRGMNEDRIRRLKSIGFDWVSKYTIKKQIWNERFEELKQFKAKYGHTDVPRRHADNPKLGRWIDNQRTRYRAIKAGAKSRKNLEMYEEQIQKIEGIGFEWVGQHYRNKTQK
mmetsp:Transcript_6667/g.8428  ORF Transcript_6667/g.8428 Transcript_6667/m.8428 type:complete len:161 (+) Transcript_6667:2-484(+)